MAICRIAKPDGRLSSSGQDIQRLSDSEIIVEESILDNDLECEPDDELQPKDSQDSFVASSGTVPTLTKRSTFQRHPWIVTVSGGYICSTCKDYASASAKSAGGKWISIPVTKSASNKLYNKAVKLLEAKCISLLLPANQLQVRLDSLFIVSLLKQPIKRQSRIVTWRRKCLDWHFSIQARHSSYDELASLGVLGVRL